eukprot:NODE_71_length_23666_cov_0.239403.p10 type:complete len:171 gc:universal NODE_71_length_23666_cov_0.239403:1409-897(-)
MVDELFSFPAIDMNIQPRFCCCGIVVGLKGFYATMLFLITFLFLVDISNLRLPSSFVISLAPMSILGYNSLVNPTPMNINISIFNLVVVSSAYVALMLYGIFSPVGLGYLVSLPYPLVNSEQLNSLDAQTQLAKICILITGLFILLAITSAIVNRTLAFKRWANNNEPIQ